ncbi:MAG: bifunctional diaminohydroxyphosphoribosylaminopyrimidine deaminase/5-amino-6-(5-phosphoribosylamino)uracil reductase RibD [Winogradskyella sp.]|uniref:bifunctional diaminohydroxyphosphoribosylaminopyrimidine deaminase/5-amino-6-(5-phosphoribosylamino)uracil reductase RibD n=1 Tax=Winogradskyella sp. TaxID=1883156 RepID=UPI0018245A01|nr:bifunctional diaminohydroxyphosphoribosylaminopyrimidine deaminase/5-amino-6-(5-phosphoribosylamino)uracil reductase RibD [Winogradskyella sp.]MBT8245828.1 bifunctional diaminohydroxyphosphoribosylaminopyrimidine deaminase/5-amino-6-(5-phosphoribosylamino)uracil reductase RibD [Winogradskyella sp.]NNK22599.1 bifunctional diaminohydroxyphosphoribosylaminopyrimidine deaminase/5-amino-6-(5-phosphoribosylamino)uracil reductase RibD [Winogradskyella sp.]
MKTHEVYIKRSLQIAKNGLGTTRPNPMVGAVIVYNNIIIGEGYTSPCGGPHAEVNAINSVKDKSLLQQSTLYVTLEPCSHYGKTPPCSDVIIKHKIPEVVVGCVDDNPEVSGKGIAKLKASGCNVTVGVLEDECIAHHKRFFTYHNKKRPYIILKWAETKNGFIAPKTKHEQKPIWITNPYSRQLAHKWRAEEQAILVGTNTVIEDNPSLTVRDWTGENPIRVLLDKSLKIDKEFAVTNDKSDNIIIHGKSYIFPEADSNQKEWSINPPLNIGFSAGFYEIDWNKSNKIAHQICLGLTKWQINSIIIEGGAKTLQTFIDENLWDEARVFIGEAEFRDGVKAPIINGKIKSEQQILSDTLKIYTND